MSVGFLILIVLGIAAVGYFAGRSRALGSANGSIRALHSLPSYYGFNVFLTVITPAFGLMFLWLLVQPLVVDYVTSRSLPQEVVSSEGSQTLVMGDVRRIARGLGVLVETGRLTPTEAEELSTDGVDVRSVLGEAGIALGADVDPAVLEAAKTYRSSISLGRTLMMGAVLLAAIGGFAVSFGVTNKDFRARNTVERGILIVLIAAASIAILTTLGIILSLLFETSNFFRMYPWQDFLFNTTWNPQFRGGSDLGILPLLWGTLYVSFVALVFAVPVGLFAAIYLSEYATPRVRSVAKPVIEILAGIPTIVYGLFALITVGPLLRDYFASPMGFGESSSSVMTAGLVMGIMLIPFVSSLSDDIINAVPQAMRDGSFGLGATHSETIRQVIIPAALPGIVGAILLAASRAIGETMIVVMGAGAAAKLSLNPFEAMTTITVKIVSQLTGDTEFASPETLVAFALGLSLFVVTLALNILALWIVRRYREQYE